MHHHMMNSICKYFFILFMWLLWFSNMSYYYISSGICTGLVFLILEFVYTSFIVDLKFLPNLDGNTTWTQFWLHIFCGPFMIIYYRKFIPNLIPRMIFFPLNIWFYEIIQGYFQIYMFGANLAWTYIEHNDSMFRGNIRLKYYPIWFILGFLIEITWSALLNPMILRFENYSNILLLVFFALTFITERILGCPRLTRKIDEN